MNVRFFLIVGMCVLVAAGCRRDPRLQVYIDNMNAEKRMLEDTLYDLQYDYECKLREVEKLQSELERIKGSGSDAGSAKTGKSRIKAPAASGNRLFPDLSDLEPPTVEQGMPDADPQSGKPGQKSSQPAQERPKPPVQDDVDDLEPPTLELPDEPAEGPPPTGAAAQPGADPVQGSANAGDASASGVTWSSVDPARTGGKQDPLPPDKEVGQPPDNSVKPKGKLAERWTPRAARRSDPPKRSIRLADIPPSGGAPDTSQPAGTGSLSDGATAPVTGGADDARQANRPAWRPYR
jgi:hypothetical protein